MLTDYAMGALASVWAVSLLRAGRRRRQSSVRLWGMAFGAISLSAFAGGTVHGFALVLGDAARTSLWAAVLGSIGMASLFLVAGAIYTVAADRTTRIRWTGAAGLALAGYAAWIIGRQDFKYIVYGYAAALGAVWLLHIYKAARQGSEGLAWITTGVLVSGAAAAVQISRLSLHPKFNHNDLYHIVQIAALYFLHRAGARLRDRDSV